MAGLELEGALARRPDLYLVVDTPNQKLEVKARGIVLDSAPIMGIEVAMMKPLLGAHRPPAITLPAVWTIEKGSADTDREIIAPAELQPYTSDADEEEPGPSPAAGGTPTPAPTQTPVPEPAASFRASTDSGWDLWVSDTLPPQGFFARFIAAVGDGWRRLRGVAKETTPAVLIVLRPADARRFHHLFRKGRAVLLLP